MDNTTTKRTRNFVVALAGVATAGYFAYDWRWRQDIGELTEEAAARLDAAAAMVFAPTDKYEYLPQLLASHPTVVDSLLPPKSTQHAQRANAYLEQVNASAKAAVVYILDNEGMTIASSNWREPESFVGHNYKFRPYFSEALKNGKAGFFGMGTTSMTPGYYLSHAIRKNRRTIGVAVVKVDTTRLDEEWQRYKDEIIVTDKNNIIFLSSQPDWKYRPLHPLSAEITDMLGKTRQCDKVLKPPLPVRFRHHLQQNEQIVSIRQRVSDGSAMKEVDYFLKSRPLSSSNWTINVLVPLTETKARAMRIAITAASAFGLFLMYLMYLQQVRMQEFEREKSRRALEQAHRALEQKHSELQQASEDLRIASITDPLTGAYNRRFFFESMPKIVSAANRHHFPLAIVTIDVDHFKQINDMYGHPAGDQVLQTLTALCKESLREAGIFSRFGGEEFIMALPNTDTQAAQGVAERLRMRVTEHPLTIRGGFYPVTISCGVSQYREGERGIEQALRRADDALYIAKNEGRNRVVVR